MNFRIYLVGLAALALLIWGPIDHSWPVWFLIRIIYLIAIPLMLWFLLKWTWKIWQPNIEFENKLVRILSIFIGLVLTALAILVALADKHVGNTMWLQTREGREAVGEDIILPGPDLGICNHTYHCSRTCIFGWFIKG